jgi:pre-mRNA-splicing factor ISY1
MARNQEKAQSTLSRWINQQKQENGQSTSKTKRPYLASLCDNLKDAIKWRGQILREVSAQVTLIQNGTTAGQKSETFAHLLEEPFLTLFDMLGQSPSKNSKSET